MRPSATAMPTSADTTDLATDIDADTLVRVWPLK
jgi:hypothetical protein